MKQENIRNNQEKMLQLFSSVANNSLLIGKQEEKIGEQFVTATPNQNQMKEIKFYLKLLFEFEFDEKFDTVKLIQFKLFLSNLMKMLSSLLTIVLTNSLTSDLIQSISNPLSTFIMDQLIIADSMLVSWQYLPLFFPSKMYAFQTLNDRKA